MGCHTELHTSQSINLVTKKKKIVFFYTYKKKVISCFFTFFYLIMSHLSDEDDEFLYGISDTDKVTNPLSDTKNGKKKKNDKKKPTRTC